MTPPAAAEDLTIIGTVAFDQTRERHAFYFHSDGQERYCYGPPLRAGEPAHAQGSRVRMRGRWLPGGDSVFLASSITPADAPA